MDEVEALHAAILNLPVGSPGWAGNDLRLYKEGHKDARHAAAELVATRLSAIPERAGGEIPIPQQPSSAHPAMSPTESAQGRPSAVAQGADTIAPRLDLSASTPAPVIAEIAAEVGRAMRKFPTWPTDPLHALAVLGEEFGELTKAMLQLTYEPHKTSAAEVRMEALQTAAMALRLLASLDTYEYRPGIQHKQHAAAITEAA